MNEQFKTSFTAPSHSLASSESTDVSKAAENQQLKKTVLSERKHPARPKSYHD